MKWLVSSLKGTVSKIECDLNLDIVEYEGRNSTKDLKKKRVKFVMNLILEIFMALN
jgi:hypothetical protein